MRCDDVIFVSERRWPQKWVVSKSSRTRLGGEGRSIWSRLRSAFWVTE
jgi:hypothetical protein